MECTTCNEPLKPHWKACPACGEVLVSACPGCGAALQPDAPACPACGEVLKTECVACGSALKPHWKACPECGSAVGESSAAGLAEPPDSEFCAGSGEPLRDGDDYFRCEECRQLFQSEFRFRNTSVCRSCAIGRGLGAAADVAPPVLDTEATAMDFDPAPCVPGEIIRDTLNDGSEGPEMVVVPAGKFRMGDMDGAGDATEKPVHGVDIGRAFAIGRFPVTFEEYDRYAAATGIVRPGDGGWGRGERPVIIVSWECAQEYVRWLSAETGAHYRLPTEAEWEYAARAGSETAYPWGDEIDASNANFLGPGGPAKTTPVDSYPPNDLGLHDMHGNVWEWVEDAWHDNYAGAPSDGSAWVTGADPGVRVLRGGSWYTYGGKLRSASRNWFTATGRNVSFGFRLARDL